MTELTITPNMAKKTAKFKGTIAAGELVAVTIADDDSAIVDTANLRLRFISPLGKTLAVFPPPDDFETPKDEDGNPVLDLAQTALAEEWSSDGSSLSCIISLNTVQMLLATPPGATVPHRVVLDDPVRKILYFNGECEVQHWPRRKVVDEPLDLHGYPDFVEEAKAAIEAARYAAEHTPGIPGQRGLQGLKGEKGDRGEPALISRMLDTNQNWHNVSLRQSGWGNNKWTVAVDQNVATGGTAFNADVEAEGSTTLRTLAARFADVVNVKDFGAKGDGHTDDADAIQAALDTGKTVYIPKGEYRITKELLIWKRGQCIYGDGKGYSYSNPRANAQNPTSVIIADNETNNGELIPATQVIRTRVKHRSASNDTEDDPMSCAIDIQAEGVDISNLGVWLQCNETSARECAQWDVGIFVGCRREVKLDYISVVGAFAKASIYADVTGLYFSKNKTLVFDSLTTSDANGVRERTFYDGAGGDDGVDPMWEGLPRVTETVNGQTVRRPPPAYEGASSTSIDGFSLQNSYLSGARWGLMIRGADWATGKTSKGGYQYPPPEGQGEGYTDPVKVKDTLYCDKFLSAKYDNSTKFLIDLRGEAGASDVLIFNNTIFAQDGDPTNKRMADPDTSHGGHVDWAYGDVDDCGGCLLIDGTTKDKQVINGHLILRNRFMTAIAPFNVKLVKTSSDVFIGNQIDGPNPGTSFYPFDNNLPQATISNENTYGKIYTSRAYTEDTEILCSLWRDKGQFENFYYDGSLVEQVPVKRGDYQWYHAWMGAVPQLRVGAKETVFGYDLKDANTTAAEAIEVSLRSPYVSNAENLTRIAMGTTSEPDSLKIQRSRTGCAVIEDKEALNVYGWQTLNLGIHKITGADAETGQPIYSAARANILRLGSFNDTGNQHCQIDSDVVPYTNNTYALGAEGKRWSNVYAASSVITSSDERVKESISAVPDAVLDAWGRVGWSQFRFRDSVASKGGGARIHAGVIAQRIKEAFEAAGLDATRYGLLCHDSWEAQPERWDEWDEVVERAHLDADGNYVPERTEHRRVLASPAVEAGDLWSVRYEEALAMEAAYQRRRADRMEERLARLERRLGV